MIPALFLTFTAHALGAQEVVRLWDGLAPHSKPAAVQEYSKDVWGTHCAYDVTDATLTIHRATADPTGHAVVIFPGGGYRLEAIEHEGRLIAEFLSSQGITAAVLKYRLPMKRISDQPHLLPITDARKALSLMRSMAKDLGIDATKVGVVGFSAGGHLATTVSVLVSEKEDEKPDYSALIYPVTTLEPDNQDWLEKTLFHRPMTDEEKKRYTLVDHVGPATPPAFLVHAYDDDLVSVRESELYAEALRAVGRDVEVHFFARGGHGFGPGRDADGTDQWLGLLANWIKRQ